MPTLCHLSRISRCVAWLGHPVYFIKGERSVVVLIEWCRFRVIKIIVLITCKLHDTCIFLWNFVFFFVIIIIIIIFGMYREVCFFADRSRSRTPKRSRRSRSRSSDRHRHKKYRWNDSIYFLCIGLCYCVVSVYIPLLYIKSLETHTLHHNNDFTRFMLDNKLV